MASRMPSCSFNAWSIESASTRSIAVDDPSVSYSANSVVIHTNGLAPGDYYTVKLPVGGFEDSSGNAFDGASFSFQTAEASFSYGNGIFARTIGFGGPGSPNTNNRAIQQVTFDAMNWYQPVTVNVSTFALASPAAPLTAIGTLLRPGCTARSWVRWVHRHLTTLAPTRPRAGPG